MVLFLSIYIWFKFPISKVYFTLKVARTRKKDSKSKGGFIKIKRIQLTYKWMIASFPIGNDAAWLV